MRTVELFEDSDGRLSASRFCMILGSFVMSWIIIQMQYAGTLTEGILGIYASAVVLQYGASKFFDAKVEKAQVEATAVKEQADVSVD